MNIISELPQYLNNGRFCCNGGIIGITRPRRVAAVTVVKRVAEECGVSMVQVVGYAIRFEDYSVIIVGEAYERTVHTDVLLGLLKTVQKTRSQHVRDAVNIDHKDANNGMMLEKHHGLEVARWQDPVDILYTRKPETDYVDATLITIFQIHLEEGPGDILVFLTGQEEIESVERLVHECLPQLSGCKRKLLTFPIFSSLPSEKQMRVFKPALVGFQKQGQLKKVLNGNIYDKLMSFIFGYNGRASREGPGKCYRLYPNSEFDRLKDSTISNVILHLKALGTDDIIGFDFIEQPDK
ncbi:pre-mRNA-splicing factor ATP-dependent RNA helicase DEAH10 [Olea europaea subsp. europaea]|uniref:RNA helicase n=1 Tax=Olea europaea subsp. europaea TaxID=158383 RepID=A0A8S0T641_OLEEU|nr:pre-mRNA-splicing factor ATP-dependent RNA helicase DEAH10 [Olea europaea subsp. europaea]